MLRWQIVTNQLPPGSLMPSDRYLQETYGLSRDVVRDALTALQNEGLVVRRRGQTSRVRRIYPKQPLDMTNVAHVDTRMPSPDEREDLAERTEVGIPILVVTHVDGSVKHYPGDRWTVPGPGWTPAS
jgi:DNA-binding FadR family transcriptional regulator